MTVHAHVNIHVDDQEPARLITFSDGEQSLIVGGGRQYIDVSFCGTPDGLRTYIGHLAELVGLTVVDTPDLEAA